MSEKLASLRQKGGSLSRTVLWTNPNPTTAFNAQTVTLSDSISNYDYIEVSFYRADTVQTVSRTIIPTADFINMTVANRNMMGAIGYFASAGTTQYFARTFSYGTDRTVIFRNAAQVGGNTTTYQTGAIPIEVAGLK